MLKLRHSTTSPFVRKVVVTAIETGQDSEIERVKTVTSDPALGADNPLQKIPALVLEDGTRLIDSKVICEYLDQRKGGKLILYHGWDDSLISPMNTIDYYEAVERQMGGAEATQAFARLFMIPGMDHCALGPGAWDIDYLSALDSWVDGGTAPAKLIGANVTLPPDPARILAMIGSFPIDPAQIAFTRPIYPYPMRARYKGGDPRSEASFVSSR